MRKHCLLVALCLMAAVVIGCGSAAETGTETEPSPKQQDPTQTPAPTMLPTATPTETTVPTPTPTIVPVLRLMAGFVVDVVERNGDRLACGAG